MKIKPVETANMRAFLETAQNLMHKEAGVPGLALVHGKRGMGKSFAARHYHATHEDTIYLLPDPDWDTRWLKEALCIELGITPPRGLKAKHDEIIAALALRPRLIIIDECNLLGPRVLDTVRLIAEWTEAPILLIGHEQIVTKLNRMGPLFDRLLYITEFKELSVEDLKIIAKACLEKGIEDSVLRRLRKDANGRIRPSIVSMKRMEDRCRNARSEQITLAHYSQEDIKAALISASEAKK